MIKCTFRLCLLCTFVLLLVAAGYGQAEKRVRRASGGSASAAILRGTSKASVIIVGTAGKAAWVTTKFAAKDIAWPVTASVAKAVLIKATPLIGKFAIKNGIKYVLPIALKLSLL